MAMPKGGCGASHSPRQDNEEQEDDERIRQLSEEIRLLTERRKSKDRSKLDETKKRTAGIRVLYAESLETLAREMDAFERKYDNNNSSSDGQMLHKWRKIVNMLENEKSQGLTMTYNTYEQIKAEAKSLLNKCDLDDDELKFKNFFHHRSTPHSQGSSRGARRFGGSDSSWSNGSYYKQEL